MLKILASLRQNWTKPSDPQSNRYWVKTPDLFFHIQSFLALEDMARFVSTCQTTMNQSFFTSLLSRCHRRHNPYNTIPTTEYAMLDHFKHHCIPTVDRSCRLPETFQLRHANNGRNKRFSQQYFDNRRDFINASYSQLKDSQLPLTVDQQQAIIDLYYFTNSKGPQQPTRYTVGIFPLFNIPTNLDIDCDDLDMFTNRYILVHLGLERNLLVNELSKNVLLPEIECELTSLIGSNPILTLFQGQHGRSFLHLCAIYNHATVAQSLITAGADLNLLTRPSSRLHPNKSPLDFADIHTHVRMTECLTRAGAIIVDHAAQPLEVISTPGIPNWGSVFA